MTFTEYDIKKLQEFILTNKQKITKFSAIAFCIICITITFISLSKDRIYFVGEDAFCTNYECPYNTFCKGKNGKGINGVIKTAGNGIYVETKFKNGYVSKVIAYQHENGNLARIEEMIFNHPNISVKLYSGEKNIMQEHNLSENGGIYKFYNNGKIEQELIFDNDGIIDAYEYKNGKKIQVPYEQFYDMNLDYGRRNRNLRCIY